MTHDYDCAETARTAHGRCPGPSCGRRVRTKETSIDVEMALDGTGTVDVETGMPFFDHMLSQLGRHGGLDLTVKATGDLARRRPPHRGGRGHRAGRDLGRGARGQGRHPALRLDRLAPRRGAGGGGARPLGSALPRLRRDLRPRRTPLGAPPFDPQLAEEFWRAFVTARASPCTCVLSPGRTPTTSSRPRSRRRPVVCATRCAIEGGGVPSTKGTLGSTDERDLDGGIAVLDYGIGNLRVGPEGVVHLGADARLVTDPDDAAGAAGVVLPGVGAFGRCAQALRSTGLDRAVDRCRSIAGSRSSGSASASSCCTRARRRIPAVPGLGVLPRHGPVPARRGEATPDAVEPARHAPGRRQRAVGGDRPQALGVLRPLLRARGVGRRRGDM